MIDHLATIGPAIAEHLTGWKYVHSDEYNSSYLIPEKSNGRKRGDMAIHLGHDSYKKQIHVSGCWPEGTSPRDVGAVTLDQLRQRP